MEQPQAGPLNDGLDISAHSIYNVTLCTPSQLGFASDVAIRMGDHKKKSLRNLPNYVETGYGKLELPKQVDGC